jgi:transposase-like protein
MTVFKRPVSVDYQMAAGRNHHPMKKNAHETSAAQAVPTENREIFMTLLRDSLRATAEQMLREEVDCLCGQSHRPEPEAEYRRAGSESGTCYAGGRREALIRPRVRRRGVNGVEREHRLSSYSAMRLPSNNAAAVVKALGAGMSTRSQEWASDGVMSKTAASRHWIEATAAKIAELRERDLRVTSFFGLMLDGVALAADAVVIVAIGLTEDGHKVVLDFEPGASENAAVATALVARLQSRGFGPAAGTRLFAVLDGSAPLHSAVLAAWPNAMIQRCLVHKERNLYGYLRHGDHAEASRLWRRLRLAEGNDAGHEALADLRSFLSTRNAAALTSLDEAGDELITLHTLNVPSTLNLSLLSTNAIENVIHNYRKHTAKVTRWQTATNQISRWTATALLHVEAGFRRIKGYADLPKLLVALAGGRIQKPIHEVEGLAPLHASPNLLSLAQSTNP